MGKACFRCGEVKPEDGFYPRRNECRSCYTARQRAYRARNVERYRAWQRVYDARPETQLRRKMREAGVVA